jgi:hypothetical protein
MKGKCQTAVTSIEAGPEPPKIRAVKLKLKFQVKFIILAAKYFANQKHVFCVCWNTSISLLKLCVSSV